MSTKEKNDEININEFIKIILRYKLSSLIIITISIIISLYVAISSPNKYISSAILVSNNDNNSSTSSISGLSGLAGMAGISLPNEPIDKSVEAIERIRSFDFFAKNFIPNIDLINLFAVKDWDRSKNEFVYYSNIYDASSEKWTRSPGINNKPEPTLQEAYIKYKEILTISRDDKTNFIQLSVEHYSPFIAKEWVDLIVKNINLEMKLIDQKRSSESINFLNKISSETNIFELKQVISTLLEKQMQNFMLSSSRDDYIFSEIQTALVPELKSSPKRSVILILGFLCGIFLSVLFSLAKHFTKYD